MQVLPLARCCLQVIFLRKIKRQQISCIRETTQLLFSTMASNQHGWFVFAIVLWLAVSVRGWQNESDKDEITHSEGIPPKHSPLSPGLIFTPRSPGDITFSRLMSENTARAATPKYGSPLKIRKLNRTKSEVQSPLTPSHVRISHMISDNAEIGSTKTAIEFANGVRHKYTFKRTTVGRRIYPTSPIPAGLSTTFRFQTWTRDQLYHQEHYLTIADWKEKPEWVLVTDVWLRKWAIPADTMLTKVQ